MSDKKDDGGPAFPQFSQNPWKEPFVTGGMSLRDYFAGQWITGFMANSSCFINAKPDTDYAEQAYRFADAMLKARQQ